MAHSHDNHLDHDYEQEHSFDLVARVRAAREAAEREMRKFGNVSEYEVRKIYGQRSDLNYDDESAPQLSDHPVQVPNPEESIPPKRAQSSEREESQALLNFELSASQQPAQDEED
jgi:hypothetical protein